MGVLEIIGLYVVSFFTLFTSRRVQKQVLQPYFWGLIIFVFSLIVGYALNFQDTMKGLWAGLFVYLGLPLIATIIGILTVFILINVRLESLVREVWSIDKVTVPESQVGILAGAKEVFVYSLIKSALIVITFVVFIFSLAIPPLASVIFIVGSFGFGYDLVSSVLSMAGLTMSDQISVIKSKAVQVLVLGILSTALLLVPFVGILLIPIPYIVTARLVAKWLKQ